MMGYAALRVVGKVPGGEVCILTWKQEIDIVRERLSTNLDTLHGRQSDVSEELSRGGGSQVQGGSVQIAVLLAQHATVDVLEDFIESKLADALHGVADGSGSPAQHQAPGSTLRHGHLETIPDGLVLLLVDLNPALDEVERSDGRVCQAAGQSPAHSTQGVVLHRAELTGVLITCSRYQGPASTLSCLQSELENYFTSSELPPLP